MYTNNHLLTQISENRYSSSSLDLSGRQLTDQDIPSLAKALSHNTSLTDLKLWYNQIGPEGAKVLANNTSLTSLVLGNNYIGNEGAKALANNTTLKSLNLSDNQIGPESAKALANNTSLSSLDLSYNQIGLEGAKTLAKITSLTSLVLVNNQIGDEGAKILANNTSLSSLDLSYNQIGLEGAKILANNTSLTDLKLRFNQIDPEGAKALANNTSITSLNLDGNQIGDEGAKALANNTFITDLKLRCNQIGPEGAKAFANNTSLTDLNLDINQIDDDVCHTFQAALKQGRNQRLLSLDLGRSLPEDTKEILRHNQQQNLRRHEQARHLLTVARIFLLSNPGPKTSQDQTWSFASLPNEIKLKILEDLPDKDLLSDNQKKNIINYANNRNTLNQHARFSSFLKTTHCQYIGIHLCMPKSSPPQKRRKVEETLNPELLEPHNSSATQLT